jgi:hypothetical protein
MSKYFSLDVIQTLIRAVAKIGGGALVAKGVADDDAVEAIAAGLIAVAAVVWGIRHRTPQGLTQERTITNAKLLHLGFFLPVLVLLIGCASANVTLFRAEKLATDAAYGGLVAWKAYYAVELTNRTPQAAGELVQQNETIFEASRKFAGSMMVVESLRESWATNSTASNRTALEIALRVAEAQSSNVVWLVRTYVK